METILIKAAQLILSLSILVIVHEFGHFILSKLFKVRVEKFYLFFNPWFSLYKFKPRNSETEYGIGWLPLGGYVKISGMIDESMDKETLAQPPQPWEFRTKPAWQRLLIMVGGVLMNFVLAFFIYSALVMNWGDNYIPIDKTPLYFSEVAHQAGLEDGDILLAADGKRLTRYDDLDLFRVISSENVTVLRGGQEKSIRLPENFEEQFLAAKTPLADFQNTQIDSLIAGDNAEKAGLKVGDEILSVNGVNTAAFSSFVKVLSENKDSEVQMELLRGTEKFKLTVLVNEKGKIGISSKRKNIYTSDKYNFFQSFPAGISLGVRKISFYVLQLRLFFTKTGIKSIGGFGAIGNLFPAQWSWPDFWNMTAFLSIVLGVMNLLPIPALDGGHVMFLLYEVASGRKPNDKFMEYAQIAGMVFLLLLIVYANGNDIFRFFIK
ncbi:MAG: RIP metalloprotease RseP [Dysgonamonadaceae bacterium]|jgi:regulator of sigma E protease|nr:RIP metalloprotease RseP [Dysgonamonadaceae bacterium]